MDITSYLLGKKSSGGGGGGLNWSTIGYDSTPQAIIDGYNYAKQIQNEWTSTSTLNNNYPDVLICPMVDISQRTNLREFANNCQRLISLPLLDTSNATDMYSAFSNCGSLTIVPEFNTSNVSDMTSMFSSCYNLKTVPKFNARKVTSFFGMFSSCRLLTDESLNNILEMCTGATSYTGTKTLYQLGIRSSNYPASRIQALPYYQDFVDAGWTIGYE